MARLFSNFSFCPITHREDISINYSVARERERWLMEVGKNSLGGCSSPPGETSLRDEDPGLSERIRMESSWSQCEAPPQMALLPRARFSRAPGFHFFICKVGVRSPSPSPALDHFQGLFPFQVCMVTASAHNVYALDITVCIHWNVG